MEREGQAACGDRVKLREDSLSTMSGFVYYYTIIPAVAMSNNTKDRLKALTGTVVDVTEQDGVYTVYVETDEP